MTDYFAVLGVPRRPWLDPDSLKQKFLVLSAEFHPDKSIGKETKKRELQDRYTELNAAYRSLANPKDRLSHLILLQAGASASELQNVPAQLMDLFMEVANLCNAADQFLAEKAAATSPLLRVSLFERSQKYSDGLVALRSKLRCGQEQLEKALKDLDGEWQSLADSKRDKLIPRAEEIRHLFGFYDRWINQVQERFVRLAL